MTGRERLIEGTIWMLKNVKQENISMHFYKCNTSGCWAGNMSGCPELKNEGYGLAFYDGALYPSVNGVQCTFTADSFLEFFNLTGEQSEFLFSPFASGYKPDILERLHTVLQQPGPYPEPEIANLDQEWADLQRALEQSHDQTASLY